MLHFPFALDKVLVLLPSHAVPNEGARLVGSMGASPMPKTAFQSKLVAFFVFRRVLFASRKVGWTGRVSGKRSSSADK